jgi:hypothetical protein
MNRITWAVATLCCAATAVLAQPKGHRPGSALIYPLVARTAMEDTLLCVTNTNTDNRLVPGYPVRRGDVRVPWKLVYAPEGTERWSEVDGILDLSPGDTFCALASAFANLPSTPLRGFFYVYAASPSGLGGGPIDFDFLTGEALVVGAAPAEYVFTLPAIPFKSEAGTNPNNPRNLQGWAFTDLTPNGRLDFDGVEYVQFPDVLFQPFYLDQGLVPGNVLNDEIVLLLGRSDAADIRTTLSGNVWDNRENPFSFFGYTFFCWTRVRIRDISGAVIFRTPRQQNNGPMELFSGWINIRGANGVNVFTGQITNNVPLLGAFIHRADIGARGFTTASLLWGSGARGNPQDGFAFLNQ